MSQLPLILEHTEPRSWMSSAIGSTLTISIYLDLTISLLIRFGLTYMFEMGTLISEIQESMKCFFSTVKRDLRKHSIAMILYGRSQRKRTFQPWTLA